MKTLIPLTALAALFAASTAFAQTPAYSKPSGYVTLGNPDGDPATPDVPANTDVTVSVTFERPVEHAGTISSVNGSVLALDTTGLPALTGDPASPYQIKIISGSEEGLIGLITANTTDSLTVGSVIVGNLSNVEEGAKFQISKAWTIGSYFPNNLPAGTNLLAFSGEVAGQNLAADLQFVWSGTQWFQIAGVDNGLANKSNTIIYPGESLVIRTGAQPINSFVVTGAVPTSISKTVASKLSPSLGQDTRISFTSPTDQPIENLTGMQPGDNLLAFSNESAIRNKSANEILVWTGAAWFGIAGVAGNQTGLYKLKAGQGYIYRRPVGAAPGDLTITLTQDYLENL